MVGKGGLEPPRLSAHDPKSGSLSLPLFVNVRAWPDRLISLLPVFPVVPQSASALVSKLVSNPQQLKETAVPYEVDVYQIS